MSAVVILDADFLSAFLKIERLPLLLTLAGSRPSPSQ